MNTITIDAQEAEAIPQAVNVLAAGGLVMFPTDTVYGVAARADQPKAIAKLFAAKGRSLDKAIPLLVSSEDQVGAVTAEVPEVARRLIARFWPGGLTLVMQRARHLPDILCAGGSTVAVRMPDHPLALALLNAAGGALATTSANDSGDPPALTATEAFEALGGKVELLIDGGRVPGGVASTVLDVTQHPPRVLRPGPLSASELAACWRA